MDSQKPEWNESDDQLDRSLGKIVDRIAASEPPADLVARSIELAKRQCGVETPLPHPRRFQRVAPWLVALAVAATVTLAVFVWRLPVWDHGKSDVVHIPVPQPTKTAEQLDAEWVQQSPTLWAYHQTALESSEELDDLLATHASQFSVSGPVTTVSPFGS